MTEKLIIKFRKNLSFNLLIAGCLFLTGIFLFIYFYNFFRPTLIIDSEKFNDFGTIFGGVIGTILNFAGLFLIYRTFKEQKKSFTEQSDQIKFNLLDNYLDRQIGLALPLIDKLESKIQDISLSFTVEKNGVEEVNTLKGQIAISYLNNNLVRIGLKNDKKRERFINELVSDNNYTSLLSVFQSIKNIYIIPNSENLSNRQKYLDGKSFLDAKRVLNVLIKEHLSEFIVTLVRQVNKVSSKKWNDYNLELAKLKKEKVEESKDIDMAELVTNTFLAFSFFDIVAYPTMKHFELFKITESIINMDKETFKKS